MTELAEARIAKTPVNFRAFAVPLGSLEFLAIVFEMVVVVGSSICSGIAYHLFHYSVFFGIDGFLGIGVLGAVLYMFVAKSLGLYGAPVLAGLDRRWSRLLCGWLLVVLLLTLFIFLLKVGSGVSRGSLISFGMAGGIALVTGRAVLQAPLRRAIDSGLLATRRAVLVGASDELSRLRHSDLLKKFGLTEIQRIQLPSIPDGQSDPSADFAKISFALGAARELGADEIVLAMRWDQADRIQLVSEQLRKSPLPVRLLPDKTVERFLSLPAIATGPLPTLEMQRSPLSSFEQAAKRVFDIAGAGGMLVFFLPLMIVTALLIKLDSKGPVLFRQRRNGFDGRSFFIIKFRTMHVLEDGDMVVQAKPNDPRFTRIGEKLRRHSIDELPQLVNVLRGEMSLVGPRPHAVAHDDKFSKLIASYAHRQHVKPGITGLAQVNGLRGGTPAVEDMQRRVEQDLAYVEGWSFMLDLRILLRTFGEVIRAEAY